MSTQLTHPNVVNQYIVSCVESLITSCGLILTIAGTSMTIRFALAPIRCGLQRQRSAFFSATAVVGICLIALLSAFPGPNLSLHGKNCHARCSRALRSSEAPFTCVGAPLPFWSKYALSVGRDITKLFLAKFS